jgi:hypothetical protein
VDPAPRATLANTPLPKWLVDASRTRQRFLEGKPEAGDTEESLFRPVFIFRPATRSTGFPSRRSNFTGAGAGQTKANASIDKLVKKRLAIRTYATTDRQAHTNHIPSTSAFRCPSRHNAFFRRTLRTAIISARRIRSSITIANCATPSRSRPRWRAPLVERYQLLNYDAAKDGLERSAKENMRFGNIDGAGKYLELYLTVEDQGRD